jgi:hypothetical protein
MVSHKERVKQKDAKIVKNRYQRCLNACGTDFTPAPLTHAA